MKSGHQNANKSSDWLRALRSERVYDHPVESIRILETHISWVVLTGPYAYKIKKPVNFGFLDYSMLEKRRFFCAEELRLNRRFAPEVYRDVVSFNTSGGVLRLNGPGSPQEYAVKMVQFDSANLLSKLAQNHCLEARHIDTLADTIAEFHGRVERATPQDSHGRLADIKGYAEENFTQIRPLLDQERDIEHLRGLHEWTQHALSAGSSVMEKRKREGFVRECHGDLHLRNVVLIDGAPMLFDCIEFSEALRWVDVISEIAFLVMDLQVKGYPQFAFRLLNRYAETTGDYAGLVLLDFYRVYRAMVRAKVDMLRLQQTEPGSDIRADLERRYRQHADLANRIVSAKPPTLIIMHGYSGSGKSFWAERIAEKLPAIRLRSDVERKRMAGFAKDADSRSALNQGIYTQEASDRIYQRLSDIGEILLVSGFSVILDATFLYYAYRQAARDMAERCGAHYVIADVTAPMQTLRERLIQRQGADVSEAGLEVLNKQLQKQDLLTEAERLFSVTIAAAKESDIGVIIQHIESIGGSFRLS